MLFRFALFVISVFHDNILLGYMNRTKLFFSSYCYLNTIIGFPHNPQPNCHCCVFVFYTDKATCLLYHFLYNSSQVSASVIAFQPFQFTCSICNIFIHEVCNNILLRILYSNRTDRIDIYDIYIYDLYIYIHVYIIY